MISASLQAPSFTYANSFKIKKDADVSSLKRTIAPGEKEESPNKWIAGEKITISNTGTTVRAVNPTGAIRAQTPVSVTPRPPSFPFNGGGYGTPVRAVNPTGAVLSQTPVSVTLRHKRYPNPPEAFNVFYLYQTSRFAGKRQKECGLPLFGHFMKHAVVLLSQSVVRCACSAVVKLFFPCKNCVAYNQCRSDFTYNSAVILFGYLYPGIGLKISRHQLRYIFLNSV